MLRSSSLYLSFKSSNVLARKSGGYRRRRSSIAPIDYAKSERATDAQIHHERSRRPAEVSRNDRFTGQRYEIEIAKTRAADRDRGAVCVRTSETGTFVYLPIEIEILAGD